MDKKYAKYMKYGKQVETYTSKDVYKLVEDMSADKNTVLAVNMDNYERWSLLRAWSNNQVGVRIS